jgi:hypothetical protein
MFGSEPSTQPDVIGKAFDEPPWCGATAVELEDVGKLVQNYTFKLVCRRMDVAASRVLRYPSKRQVNGSVRGVRKTIKVVQNECDALTTPVSLFARVENLVDDATGFHDERFGIRQAFEEEVDGMVRRGRELDGNVDGVGRYG